MMTVADLTDEQINEATTALLRAWLTTAAKIDDMIGRHDLRLIIFSVDISSEVIKQEGTLIAIDKLITCLLNAYKARDPEVQRRFGDQAEVTVWQADENLRDTLRRSRDRMLRAREDTRALDDTGAEVDA